MLLPERLASPAGRVAPAAVVRWRPASANVCRRRRFYMRSPARQSPVGHFYPLISVQPATPRCSAGRLAVPAHQPTYSARAGAPLAHVGGCCSLVLVPGTCRGAARKQGTRRAGRRARRRRGRLGCRSFAGTRCARACGAPAPCLARAREHVGHAAHLRGLAGAARRHRARADARRRQVRGRVRPSCRQPVPLRQLGRQLGGGPARAGGPPRAARARRGHKLCARRHGARRLAHARGGALGRLVALGGLLLGLEAHHTGAGEALQTRQQGERGAAEQASQGRARAVPRAARRPSSRRPLAFLGWGGKPSLQRKRRPLLRHAASPAQRTARSGDRATKLQCGWVGWARRGAHTARPHRGAVATGGRPKGHRKPRVSAGPTTAAACVR